MFLDLIMAGMQLIMFAMKLLENEDFCTAHYMDYLNEEMKDD